MIKKFKIFEQDLSEIDPYGEERWEGELEPDPEIKFDFDEIVWEQLPSECRICGEQYVNAVMIDRVCPDCRIDENTCKVCGYYFAEELLDNGCCNFCKKENKN
jgi:rubredoxin